MNDSEYYENIWEEGYWAGRDGLPARLNPYHTPENRSYWKAGWKVGRAARPKPSGPVARIRRILGR